YEGEEAGGKAASLFPLTPLLPRSFRLKGGISLSCPSPLPLKGGISLSCPSPLPLQGGTSFLCSASFPPKGGTSLPCPLLPSFRPKRGVSFPFFEAPFIHSWYQMSIIN